MQAIKVAHIQQQTNDSLPGALNLAEYGYYFVILYTVLGGHFGLIFIGPGFLLVPILALCMVALGPSVLTVLQTAWIPLACGASYLFIQLALHEESLYARYVYDFGPWLLALVIVQALAMHRPNFLHRFAWFTLFMGLAMLPFITLVLTGAYEKMGLSHDVGFRNPNTLAAWFGFCVLYLTIKGYVETRLAYRLATWLMAVGSLYIVGLTVSRGVLIALAGALIVASRRLLKVGFLPVALLGGLLLGLVELGLFDQALRAYTFRGGEETGRLQVWPLLIETFLNSPVIGVGASQAGAVSPSGKFITPHNCFLLLAVASGVMPLMLFCVYIFRSGMAAIRANMSKQPDAVFYLPLFVYALLIICAGNMDFMTPWAVVSLAVPIAASVYPMHQDDTENPRTRTTG